MTRATGAALLAVLFSLAGCAHRTPAPAAPLPQLRPAEPAPPPPPSIRPSEVSPQASSAEEPVFTQTGVASFYAARFHGRKTASGRPYDRESLTAAHRTLAFGMIVRVTNTANGRVVKVQVNDRGPHAKNRIIDLSHAAARALGIRNGIAHVRLQVFESDQPAPVRPD